MAGDRQRQVFFGDSAPIVGDANHLDATLFDGDFDLGGPSVDRIFQQFFDDAGGALNHFSRRDFVDDAFR